MRRKLAVLLGVVLGLGFMFSVAQAADKFAYLDLSKTFSEYGKTKDFDKALTEKQTAYESEREKKITDIKQFQDKLNLLSAKEKEAKKSDMEAKLKAIQEFDRQKQTDLKKEQDEKMKEIFKDIETAVKIFAEKEGYTMVFNDRVLVYQNKSMDVTDKILAALNKGYKK